MSQSIRLEANAPYERTVESFVASTSRRLATALSSELGNRNRRIDSICRRWPYGLNSLSRFPASSWESCANNSPTSSSKSARSDRCPLSHIILRRIDRSGETMCPWVLIISQHDALIDHNHYPVKIENRIRIAKQQQYKNSALLDAISFYDNISKKR